VQLSIVVVAVGSIVMILVVALQCPKNPSYSEAGVHNRGAGNCFALSVTFYWQAGFNIGSDVFIILLPMPLLLSLHMRMVKRFSLVAVFAVSFLIPIASAVRLWALNLWANSGPYTLYYGGYILFWSVVLL
jgi:vacuolar-type H+-ATPase subunit I/STV1